MSVAPRLIPHAALLAAVWLVIPSHDLRAQRAYYDPVPDSVLSARLDRVVPRNSDRAETLTRLFREAGCTNLTEQSMGAPYTPNLICTLPGREASVIIVSARYDNYWGGEGAVNNWTGASMLPSLYESLARLPRRHTFVFAAFSDQARRFTGANVYLAGLKSVERENLRAAVTLSGLGVGPLKISWLAPGTRLGDVLHMVAREMNRPLPAVEAEPAVVGESSPFAWRKIPTIGLSSLTPATRHFARSAADRLSAVDRSLYYQSYQLISAYLAYLDVAWGQLPSAPASSRD
jgi:hypothetical protein